MYVMPLSVTRSKPDQLVTIYRLAPLRDHVVGSKWAIAMMEEIWAVKVASFVCHFRFVALALHVH